VTVFERALKWSRREPSLPPDEDLPSPILDDELEQEMRAAAELAASTDSRLDYSLARVDVVAETVVSGRCSGVEIHRYGAYVGEVLRRNGTGFAWGYLRARPRGPGLVLGKWLADPFDLIERHARPRPDPEDTLTHAVSDLLAHSASPTVEAAVDRGWSVQHQRPTAWEDLKEDLLRTRRRWRRRRSRR
jgi:hypothetical protein